tara:strand:+ start:2419 stop:3045 length:627 start_codon:yes stop_codon:yes gene_type:complete
MKVNELIVGRIYQSLTSKSVIVRFDGENKGSGFGTLGDPTRKFSMMARIDWEDITDVFNNLYMEPTEQDPLSFSVTSGGVTGLDYSVDTLSLKPLQFKAEGIRQFNTGANRNSDEGKLDFEGFLSPLVLEAYAVYMNSNRSLENGDVRASDNWQKGIPKDAYMKSMWRHFFDVWKDHRGIETEEDEITNLCGLLFNVSGMLYEKLKEK